jgi:2-succinyl-6-hydroxy-2,4-cyclohexadiene-1-carboxylate synthase
MPLFGKPGERISYEIHAQREGAPPIVLMHGFTASSASFLSNVERLSERFTVITVELLGHGSSDAPLDPAPYAPGAAIERIIRLMDELGHEEVLLCGHSLGGALALRMALDAPERVAGLVVINSISASGTPEWRDGARENSRKMGARARTEGTAFLRKTNLYPAHSRRLPDDAREALVRDFDRIQPAGFAGTAEALVADVNAFERIHELQMPTLVVIGDRDRGFLERAPAMIAQIRPDLAHSVTIENAGHAANLEQPEAFEAALLNFAEGIGYLGALPPNAPTESKLRSLALTGVGAVLVAVGTGLFAWTIIGGGDDKPGGIRAQNVPAEPTAISTSVATSPVETVAGARTSGSGSPTVSPASPTATPAAPSTALPTATTPATAAPATAPSTATPVPTETPAPPTVAIPLATATPVGGLFASISGPVSVAPGGIATFVDSSPRAAEALNRTWTYPGGTRRVDLAVSVTFPIAPGCYPVTLAVVFPSGTRTASMLVSVGGASC